MRCFSGSTIELTKSEKETSDAALYKKSISYDPTEDRSTSSHGEYRKADSSRDVKAPRLSTSTFWQRCRMSLDSSRSKYAKIDECMNMSSVQSSSQAKLQSIVAALVQSKLTAFASVSLVSQFRNTFGVLTACGEGAQFWPPALSKDDGRCFSLITSRAFPIEDSNWSIEDAVDSMKPLYYDCYADASDLPKEAIWLKRVGMHAMVTFPCVHKGGVHGVLTVGIPSSSMDHILIRKLSDLATSVTPLVVDSCKRLRSVLSPPCGKLHRFESQNDIAAAVMDEMLGLDKIVMTKLWSATPAVPLDPHSTAAPTSASAALAQAHLFSETASAAADLPLSGMQRNPYAQQPGGFMGLHHRGHHPGAADAPPAAGSRLKPQAPSPMHPQQQHYQKQHAIQSFSFNGPLAARQRAGGPPTAAAVIAEASAAEAAATRGLTPMSPSTSTQ